MSRMNCSQLLKHYGTKVAIAEAGGVDRQVVHGWFQRGSVPLDQQIKYEVATGGLLKADVAQEFRDVVARGEAA